MEELFYFIIKTTLKQSAFFFKLKLYLTKGYSERKTQFYSMKYKNGCLVASDLFHMFTQLIKLYIYIPLSRKEGRCLKYVIHQRHNKNEWLLLSASFAAKFRLAFVLTLETFS